jgi:DNA-directed RNA polymerase specialized sigma24 family protein
VPADCDRMAGPGHDAEDLTRETFLHAWLFMGGCAAVASNTGRRRARDRRWLGRSLAALKLVELLST